MTRVNRVRDSIKCKTEHKEGEDACARTGIASKRFDSRTYCAALTESAHTGSEPHAQSGAYRHQVKGGGSAVGCKHGNGEAEHCKRHKNVLKFPHSSPASLNWLPVGG